MDKRIVNIASTAEGGDKQFEERVLDRYPDLQGINVARVLYPLFQAGAVTTEFDDISDVRSRSKQVNCLLDVLSGGLPTTFDMFCTVMDTVMDKVQARLAETNSTNTSILEEEIHASDQQDLNSETLYIHEVRTSLTTA